MWYKSSAEADAEAPSAGVDPRLFFYGRIMCQASIFCDEAGEQDMSDGYYLLTLVMHDQSNRIDDAVKDYEGRLRLEGLPNIAFHMVDLLHGHGDYEGLDTRIRWSLLLRFSAFVRRLSVRYHTFTYSAYDVAGADALSARMRRDMADFLYSRLSTFQSFETVVVYYDQGQQAVTNALHRAFDYMLGDGVVDYRLISYQERRLAQVADYLSSIELAGMRFETGNVSRTYDRFYGTRGEFRRNFLKQVRRKLM